jgi:hypothetical protein
VAGPITPRGYRERLTTPWWAHPVVVALAVVVALESSFLAGGLTGQLVVVVAFGVAGELVVWRYGSRLVEVENGRVRAGGWRLPVRQVRAVAVLDAAATRTEMRRGDATVYRCTRSWIPTAVMLEVDDPDDLPMWLVSTRHPHLLAAALADAAQVAAAAAGSPAWTPTPGAR